MDGATAEFNESWEIEVEGTFGGREGEPRVNLVPPVVQVNSNNDQEQDEGQLLQQSNNQWRGWVVLLTRECH